MFDEKHHAEKHVPLGDKIWLDRERCIQCARCIRFQDEVVGEPVLAFYQRGRSTDIITRSEPPFDLDLLRQYHRYLPGGCADHRGLPLWCPPVGDEILGLHLRPVPGGLQRDLQYPPGSPDGR